MGRRPKEEIEKIQDEVENAAEFSISDLDGIGDKKLEKLAAIGITTPYHLAMASPQEVSSLIDIDFQTVSDMIEKARLSLESKNVVEKSIISADELYDFRKGHVQKLTTGIELFDEIIGGGFESGVITELFGQFGTFKTQICTMAAINAQLPKEKCCLHCDSMEFDKDKCVGCGNKIWSGGGLSEKGNPCKVIYLDAENSFRPERAIQMICEWGLVKTKEQTKMEEKNGVPKEPLNDEEFAKARLYLKNIIVLKAINSGHQIMLSRDFGKVMDQYGNVKLIIVDSIISQFRKDFGGRGELSNRQMFLSKHIRYISRAAETYNCVAIITNQVQQSPGAFGDPTKPVGGMFLGHTSKHRIYLQPKGKEKVTAILIDSPDNARNELVLTCTVRGMELGE